MVGHMLVDSLAELLVLLLCDLSAGLLIMYCMAFGVGLLPLCVLTR